jgi:hypothetical protein
VLRAVLVGHLHNLALPVVLILYQIQAGSVVILFAGENDQWVREWLAPPPPRYRNEVNSSYLPASGFPAPGGPVEIAPYCGGPVRSAYA